jgi:hypothetical protein
MRERALIHVAGPFAAGKTTFVERLLNAEVAFAICVRAEQDPKLRKEQESAPKSHAELRRYREAGASAVSLYRFAEPSTDAFFMSEFMQDYSEAVFIEGDCPIDYVSLSVFIAPVPTKGRSLLRQVVRDHAVLEQVSPEQVAQALGSPVAMAHLVPTGQGGPVAVLALTQPWLFDMRPRAFTERWAIAEEYAGIERAQLIVINLRAADDRRAAEALVEDIARLRKDDAVFRDVLGHRGNKLPVTAIVADLSNPKDAGLKKAIARVKRTTRRRAP